VPTKAKSCGGIYLWPILGQRALVALLGSNLIVRRPCTGMAALWRHEYYYYYY